MVDKKLSEFSQITPAEISKLICLYLDENDAIKNGVVDFAALDALLAHKAGTETFTGNKTFSGDTVFSGNATFNNTVNANISGNAPKDGDGNTISSTYTKLAANNTFSGANVFNGDANFNGIVNLPNTTYIKPQDSYLEGGEIHFVGAPNEPNSNKTVSIDRYNGRLRLFGFSSGGTPVSFNVDMQNDSIEASNGVRQSIVYWGIPNYAAIVSVGNVTDRAAPSNVLVQCSLTGRAIGYLSVGGQTFYINHQDGYGTTNYIYRDFYIPKGWKYTTSGLSEVYEIPLMGG